MKNKNNADMPFVMRNLWFNSFLTFSPKHSISNSCGKITESISE